MDHIELSSAEVEKTLNDTACCVLILDIALSDKNIPKFTIMAMKVAKAQLRVNAALIKKMHTAIGVLFEIVSDMRHLADSLAEYANAVTTNEHIACEKPAEPINPDDFVPIYDPETDQPEIKEAEPPQPDVSEVLFAKMSEFSRAGHKAKARELIQKYGGQKFSDLKAEVYPAMLAELEAMM